MPGTTTTSGFALAPELQRAAHAMEQLRGAIGARWSSGTDSLDRICSYALETPGKLFRPGLLLESARVVGGDIAVVMPAAVGTECGHVASLIHDDIIDNDHIRRGKDAVHKRFGVDDAIVAGDALIFDLFLALAECRGSGATDARIVGALEIAARSGIELCRGQALEAEICARRIMDTDTYMRMISMKTAALFRAACQGGGLLVGAPTEWVDALGSYGEHLGIAFQIQDDLLPYVTEAALTDKPPLSDLRNGRLTLPVLLGFRDGTSFDRGILDAALSSDSTDDDALSAVTDVLRRVGALEECSRLAREQAEMARKILTVFPHSPSRDRLASYAARAVDRKG